MDLRYHDPSEPSHIHVPRPSRLLAQAQPESEALCRCNEVVFARLERNNDSSEQTDAA